MSNVIDIERLAEMPITDEFLDILVFPMYEKPNSKRKELYLIVEENKIIYSSMFVYLEISSDGRMHSYMKSTMGKQEYPILNAFQIVRYIDKYLNGGKSDVEKLVQDIQDSIDIGIVKVEDTDNVMFGTVKKLAEKYL